MKFRSSPAERQAGYAQGARDVLPVLLAAMPFGVLFGALAVKNGFSVFEAVLMSATIYAGASQMVGIELFGQDVAPWMIVLSIFAVNFRHVLYSAAIGRLIHRWSPWQKAAAFFLLVDPQYAETERRKIEGKPITGSWYFSFALILYGTWIVEAYLGARFGNLITDPYRLGLDFLLPIYFLGLVLGFRKRPRWLPVVLTSAAVSLAAFHFIGSPWHISIGALAGIALAAFLPLSRRGEFD